MTAIVKQIVDWINEENKHVWWKHTIRVALAKGELNAEELDLICKIAQMEANFIEKCDVFDSYCEQVSSAGFEDETKQVILKSIGPVQNVATLSENQILTFAKTGITVIYGDNGVGKSSYARILKNACLARGRYS